MIYRKKKHAGDCSSQNPDLIRQPLPGQNGMPIVETIVAFVVIPFFWGLFCHAATMTGANIELMAIVAGAVSLASAVMIACGTAYDAARNNQSNGMQMAFRYAALVALATAIPVLVVRHFNALGFALSVLGIVVVAAAIFAPALPSRRAGARPAR